VVCLERGRATPLPSVRQRTQRVACQHYAITVLDAQHGRARHDGLAARSENGQGTPMSVHSCHDCDACPSNTRFEPATVRSRRSTHVVALCGVAAWAMMGPAVAMMMQREAPICAAWLGGLPSKGL
jgi:hypothetical protein